MPENTIPEFINGALKISKFSSLNRSRVWSPAVTNEYIPMPPAPPNWVKPTLESLHYE